MKHLTCLVFVGLAHVGMPAHAEFDASRLWVNAGFYSAHFDTEKSLRNANPGIGFEYALHEDWSVTAGRFINSDNAHSSYIGVYYQPWRLGSVKLASRAVGTPPATVRSTALVPEPEILTTATAARPAAVAGA